MRTVPREELDLRMDRLRRELHRTVPEWRAAAIMGKVNLYYLTGTMPSGVLVIPRDEEAVLWVRRSYARSVEESEFPRIEPMRGFRDLANGWRARPAAVLIEKDVVSLAHAERFNRHLGFDSFGAIEPALTRVRAVKSPYEMKLMRRAGEIHRRVLEDVVPGLIEEGISEAELGAEVLRVLLREGHHAVTRVCMFETELFMGQVCFGSSSVRPNAFDGPGGVEGLCAAVPLFGSQDRCLKRNELVVIDVGCGVEGYHTDKTMTYAFGDLPEHALRAHRRCVDIQADIAARLRPGMVPSAIYEEIVAGLGPAFREGFMGLGEQQVRFLGHGVGLHIDEYPAIAEGFDEPLEANMTLALEPKKGVPGVGLVGIEDTFVVTPEGGCSITGANPGMIPV